MSGNARSDWRRGRSALSPATPGSCQTALWNQIWSNVVKRYEVDLTDEERAAADAWINDRFFSGAPDQRPTLEWFLEEVAIFVTGSGSCTSIPVTDWRRHAARASVTMGMYCVVAHALSVRDRHELSRPGARAPGQDAVRARRNSAPVSGGYCRRRTLG